MAECNSKPVTLVPHFLPRTSSTGIEVLENNSLSRRGQVESFGGIPLSLSVGEPCLWILRVVVRESWARVTVQNSYSVAIIGSGSMNEFEIALVKSQ